MDLILNFVIELISGFRPKWTFDILNSVLTVMDLIPTTLDLTLDTFGFNFEYILIEFRLCLDMTFGY